MGKEMGRNQNLHEKFLPIREVGSNNSTKTAKQIHEMLLHYFVSDAGIKPLHNFDKDFVRFYIYFEKMLLTQLRPIFLLRRNQETDL